MAESWLNSAEPMCDGSDSTVVLCDDFERTNWYLTKNNYGGTDNFGWSGDFESSEPSPCVCGSAGVAGTDCTAQTGTHIDVQNWAGSHYLGPTSRTTYNEIYHRLYLKWSSGYDFGHEKICAYQHDENITGQVAHLFQRFQENKLSLLNWEMDAWMLQNQGVDITITPGDWYYVEVHFKLNSAVGTADGQARMWMDNVGADGLTDPGAGTLRLNHNNIELRRSNTLHLGWIYHEFWLPPFGDPNCCGGGNIHHDQVIVRTQRVSPMALGDSSTTRRGSMSPFKFTGLIR